MIDIRAEIVQSDKGLLEMDVFLVDMASNEFVMEASGLAQLLYADGEVAAEIAFDEYFGNSNGAFKLVFSEFADYQYQGIKLTINSPLEAKGDKLVSLSDKIDLTRDLDNPLTLLGPGFTEL